MKPYPFQPAPLPSADAWHVHSSERQWTSAHVQVDEVRIHTPTRQEQPARWTVVRRRPAVAMAAYLEDGSWVLIQQERIPVMTELWEFPAGQIDSGHTEDAVEMQRRVEHTALRELQEEAGLTLAPDGSLQHLGHVFLSPGFTDEICYLVRVGPMRKTEVLEQHGGEVITHRQPFTPQELLSLVQQGQLTNALSLALFAKIQFLE
jgi:ADP-ribose pyrophosphatase